VALPQTVPFLGWAWNDLLFLLLAGLMLGMALLVVIGRNIIRSGLAMILSFAALAGIYVLLGAPLVAAAQVLIYIGAISVLVLFAIMLTQSKEGPANLVFHHQAWAAGIASIVLAVLLVGVFIGTQWPLAVEQGASATTDVARLLFSEYILAFEVVSVLLLAAVIGGVFIAKREDAPDPGERSVEPTLGTIERPITVGPRTQPFPSSPANAAEQAARTRQASTAKDAP
jgi:NADH:ubiquinone oxidoreductase subunit 6 (subunit J)